MADTEKKGFFAEFKTFISRGSVVDMAVGIIVGGMFTTIVQSFVSDILNPILGILIGDMDFSELRIVLKAATDTTAEVAIRYGSLLQNIIQFLLTALVLFTIVRAMNKLKADAEKKAKEFAEKAEK
jgi:large conductance mechanosensitive channel